MPGAQPNRLVVYVDVDDTLIRTVGSKRIPISMTIDHVRSLHVEGAQLFCWSSGGCDYARSVARELGIETCFVAFLPKPQIMLDDQEPQTWRFLRIVHPEQCGEESAITYNNRS